VESQGDDRDIRIVLLEPVNQARSNRMGVEQPITIESAACNHRSIQSKGFIVAEHGCDVVTSGFKHSRSGYELASVVSDLQYVTHSDLRGTRLVLLLVIQEQARAVTFASDRRGAKEL
jgi:hypothetical protein